MTITIRPANDTDAEQMSELLNEIIAVGGTTAFLDPVSPQTIRNWMAQDKGRSLWHVAQNESGHIVGYQSAEVAGSPAPEALNMASFVRIGVVGQGVGSKLFAETTKQARKLGYTWLNACIRSDNSSGLSYYSKMGFTDWKSDPDAALSDGRVTGRSYKRYVL